MSEQLPQLHMRRKLERLPSLIVPPGYALRPLQPSDAAAWAALLAQTGELGDWSLERAAPYFAPSGPMLLAGSYFLTHNGAPIATAQLHLHHDDEYAPIPELGWVAVSRAQRGRGLGYIVSLAVLHYAASAGHRDVFLRTDDHRLPAISTYLKLGFQPWLRDASAPPRWDRVLQAIGKAASASSSHAG